MYCSVITNMFDRKYDWLFKHNNNRQILYFINIPIQFHASWNIQPISKFVAQLRAFSRSPRFIRKESSKLCFSFTSHVIFFRLLTLPTKENSRQARIWPASTKEEPTGTFKSPFEQNVQITRHSEPHLIVRYHGDMVANTKIMWSTFES